MGVGGIQDEGCQKSVVESKESGNKVEESSRSFATRDWRGSAGARAGVREGARPDQDPELPKLERPDDDDGGLLCSFATSSCSG